MNFFDLSFDTICGYKANAALMHYKAKSQIIVLKVTNEGLLLIDSGGQYLDGTIDTTRTFVLGQSAILNDAIIQSLTKKQCLDYKLLIF